MSDPRVVSLVPSATETLIAWGIVPIGVTRWCERPGLPQVGGTKDPDLGAIVGMGPDLVVMDEEENRREDAEFLVSAGLEVHALAIRSVVDVGPQLGLLAARVERGDRWEPPALPPPAGVGRAVFVPIWRQSAPDGGEGSFTTVSDATYGSSVLAALGLGNVYAGASEPYPKTTLADARARRPDLVLAPSEPYKFTRRHLPELQSVAPVVFVDGQDLFWWGVRTAGALERLGRLVTAQ